MATHVAVMKEGVIEQFGAPESLLARPASAFVATFVGTPPANVIAVRKVDSRLYLGDVALAAAGAYEGGVSLLYAPTSLALCLPDTAPAERVTEGSLLEVAPMAGRYVCAISIDGQRVSVVTESPPSVQTGARVGIRFPELPQAVFDAGGRQITEHPALRRAPA